MLKMESRIILFRAGTKEGTNAKVVHLSMTEEYEEYGDNSPQRIL